MADGLEFKASLDRTRIPPKAESEVRCQLQLSAPAVESAGSATTTSNIALVFDCSGSMAGQKRETAIDAAKSIVETINERHRLSLIGFSSQSRILLDNAQAKTGEREKLKKSIEEKI